MDCRVELISFEAIHLLPVPLLPKKMAIQKKKLNSYTEEKNNQPPVKIEEAKIVGETDLIETKIMVPVKEFAMPIATPEQLQKGMELYQKCLNALIKSSDVVMVDKKPHGKKIAVNKINRVFGVSTEVLRSFMEEHIAYKDHWSKGFRKTILVHTGEKYSVAKAWVKAILPNGQYCTRGGAVSETERRFAHFPHDLLATAETRAMKNAAENLLGIEFEMVEEGNGNQQPQNNPQPPRNLRKNETLAPNGTIERQVKPGIKEVGIDPSGWKPMYKVNSGLPSNPKLPASKPQMDWIINALEEAEVDLADDKPLIFVLGRRPVLREVELTKLTKGDACDIICAIKKRELDKVIKK